MSETKSYSAISAYLSGFKNSLSAWKVWGLLYAINFLFTLIIIAPLAQYLEKTIGNSLLVEKWADGFNYTVMHDFLANYEVSIATVTELTLVIGAIYLVFSIFTSGGIIEVFYKNDKGSNLRNFWSGCTYYFWRMLRITIYFLLIHAVVAGLFGFIFTQLAPENPDSELQYLNLLKIILPIYLISAFLVAMWQDFTKIIAVQRDESLLVGSFKSSTSFVFKNLGRVSLFYILNLLTLGVFYFFYRCGILNFTGMNAVFFFGQILVIGRIGIKIWNAAGGVLLTK
ncbi:MAG: hypothetical protein ACI85O_000748 [Saprospiraceae bacterium]